MIFFKSSFGHILEKHLFRTVNSPLYASALMHRTAGAIQLTNFPYLRVGEHFSRELPTNVFKDPLKSDGEGNWPRTNLVLIALPVLPLSMGLYRIGIACDHLLSDLVN